MDGSYHVSNGIADTAQRIAEKGHEWAEREAAASWLEETRRNVRAQLAVERLEEVGSVSKAELIAEASPVYSDHLRAMVAARKAANIAKVNYEAAKTWVDLCRSKEATNRALINLR